MPVDSLRELRDAAQRAVSSANPDLFDGVAKARRSRVPRFSKPLVVFTRDDPTRDPKQTPVTPPGSVTLFWAPRGSTVLRTLHAAFVANDFSETSQVWPRLVDAHRQRSVGTVEEAVSSILAAGSFFELRYRTKTLASYLWLDKSTELGSITLPYTGDALDASQFSIVEFARHERRGSGKRERRWVEPCPAWDTLVVVNEPILSELELRVLQAVPVEQTEMFIASPGDVMVTPAALVVILVFVAINTIVTGCCGMRDLLTEVSYPPDQLVKVSADLAAVELIELRAEIFEEVAVL